MTEIFEMLVGEIHDAWGWTMFILGWLDAIWQGGVGSLVKWVSLAAGAPALLWRLLPRYVAVSYHDGKSWYDRPSYWLAHHKKPLADVVRSELGMLRKGRVDDEEARIPRAPKMRYHHTKWWGRKRGVYYVIGVRILDQSLMEGYEASCQVPVIRYQKEDEYLPIR